MNIYGTSVPKLATFDTVVSNFMTAKGIGEGALTVRRNGAVVYDRAFQAAGMAVPRIRGR